MDELAAALDRDRSAISNGAINTYLELRHWQVGHIRRPGRGGRGVEGAPHDEVFERVWTRIDDRLTSSD